MTHGRLSSQYIRLLSAIHAVGKVPCESYPDMFFPEDIPDPNIRHTVTVIAKGMCGGCPVKNQCFEYALETQQKHGIWGGTSPDER